jgi:hypothetical protein
MAASRRTVTLCGQRLHGLQHVCAFFESREEQYEVLNPYFREGLETGDQVVTIVESAHRADHVRHMTAGGVPVEAALGSGQLSILASEQTYVRDGVFVVDRMYDLLRDALRGAAGTTFPSVRTFGDMEWALRNLPGTEDLMVYEAKVNQMAPDFDCTLLCGYDINRFSGRAIADVLATHSHVVLGGRIHENPYFVDPVTFLRKLALRRSSDSPLGRQEAARPLELHAPPPA